MKDWGNKYKNVHETIFRFIMQNTGKRCVILLVFIILRWSFNYESNVFRYNKILIDCVFGNSKCVVPSTLTIDLGFASFNSQGLGVNKLAIPSYPVNKYIMFFLRNYLCINSGSSLTNWIKSEGVYYIHNFLKTVFNPYNSYSWTSCLFSKLNTNNLWWIIFFHIPTPWR